MITGHIHKIYFCDGTITVIRRMLKLNSGLVIKNTFLTALCLQNFDW